MATSVIDVDAMVNQIVSIMRQYSAVTIDEVDRIAQQVANRGALKLRTAGSFKNRRGDYRTGWRAKRLAKGRWVVHNATDYRLTHLLERGHAMSGGGRKDAKAFPHIKNVEQQIIQEFEREIREALGG